ncbi:hypothetical protein [Futiania mangrovi]|uniref:Uncharacterized protein n=1 Tax=Futiania mangrovi TaxID=2959716 RepID=A0A9J6PBC5_9PROT|nr:hypothetical protein [Futiania mangrovii]MCP1337436.1 hypothetical protein [Futiania mangrovii]
MDATEGKLHLVYALTGHLPKYIGCMSVPEGQIVPAIFERVFGPATEAECTVWIAENCTPPLPEYLRLVPGGMVRQPMLVSELTGRPLRIYTKGEPLSQDYRPERISVELDTDGLILRLWAG